MARGSGPVPAYRWPLPWLEIALPAYAAILVVLHYSPGSLTVPIADERVEQLILWVLKIFGWAFGGMLALSGVFLAFFLLYSPIYLALNLRQKLEPGVWVDPHEFRFYLCCFGLLCGLVMLTLWNPQFALVTFVVLAGCAQLLWRVLL